MGNNDVKLPEPDLLFGTPADGSPLKDYYTEATVRRLIAEAVERERQRWAKAFDSMREATLAAQSGPDNELENVMLRQLAELGFGECARALRAGNQPDGKA